MLLREPPALTYDPCALQVSAGSALGCGNSCVEVAGGGRGEQGAVVRLQRVLYGGHRLIW